MKNIKIPKQLDYVHKTLLLVLITLIIMLVGASMNIIVIYSNNCQMPVEDLGYDIATHFSYYKEDYKLIDYYYFSDRYRAFGYIYSIGDLIMSLDFILVFWIIFRMGRWGWLR